MRGNGHTSQRPTGKSGAPDGTPPGRAIMVAPCPVLGVSLENELANAFLGGDIGDWAEESEAPALTVNGVLTGRERDGAAAAAVFPNRKSDQLQAFERPNASRLNHSYSRWPWIGR